MMTILPVYFKEDLWGMTIVQWQQLQQQQRLVPCQHKQELSMLWLPAHKSWSPPPARAMKVAAKKKCQDLTPTPLRRSNRVLDQDKRSRSTKGKPQVLDLAASVSPKKPAARKIKQKVMAPPPAATTVAKKREKTRAKFTGPEKKKAVGRIGMALHEWWSKENVCEL